MKRRIFLIMLSVFVVLSCVVTVSAEEEQGSDVVVISELTQEVNETENVSEVVATEETQAEEGNDGESANVLTSEKFTLTVDVVAPDGIFTPSVMRFNLFTENDEWLGNQYKDISQPGRYVLEFPVLKYEIGTRFTVVGTTGFSRVNFCDVDYNLEQPFVVGTYAYRNEFGELILADGAHVCVYPLSAAIPADDPWEASAEARVNDKNIWSDTPYLIWVSKGNFTVSVFLKQNGKWDCIKSFPCSIGAPGTPTVTGQFRYYQYQNRWQYNGYYVGPIMRFYNGYAIHSTLVNNNGTDRDGRVGKMISHGCVRVRPENIRWLTDYIPLGTKIYITND